MVECELCSSGAPSKGVGLWERRSHCGFISGIPAAFIFERGGLLPFVWPVFHFCPDGQLHSRVEIAPSHLELGGALNVWVRVSENRDSI